MIKKIVKVSATWCGPCKMFSPIFEEVAKMNEFSGIEFKEYDAEENPEFSEKYGIRSVPTTIFFDENENEVKRISGAMSKTNFIDLIKQEQENIKKD
jgi:thioredoxin